MKNGAKYCETVFPRFYEVLGEAVGGSANKDIT